LPSVPDVEVTYCVVNTQQRELLVRGLDAIALEREAAPFTTEVIVLDNASTDGSVGAARGHATVDRVITRDRRTGKAENDTALEQNLRAGAAGARLLRPGGKPQASAWRFPGPASALASALFIHRWTTVQSRGDRTRPVDWAQSAALLVRSQAAREIGWFDPQFFVYSDEVDFCKRLSDAGWHTLFVPGAQAIHHEQLSTGGVPERRIVELSRNRDRYMRKHHSALSAALVRWLTAWAYGVRSVAATVLPGHDPRRYRRHVRATLRPDEGEGLREAARDYNVGGTRL